MQNKINRVLSLVLVVIMVLSMIPAAFAEEDSGSAAYAAENTTTGEQYADISDAIAEAQAGQTVKALADAQDVAYGNEGVILDLNGHDLTVTAAEGVTVSAIDSATDDYEGPYGTLTTEGKVATTVKTSGDIKSYVTIAENGSYSFHRYYASIAAISLKPAQAALGYRAEFRGDEAVKNAVVSYGYELWVNDNAHKTYTRTDALESGSLTLRLKNILAEGNDALNALGSTATIGGNAFITLDLGGEQVKLQGTEQLTTLRQVVESINANVSAYGEAQLQSVRDMITTYAAWMEGWNTDAIFGKGEGEGDDSGLDVEITVDVNAQDGVLAEDAVLSSDDITVTVPQGTVLEEGTTQLTLTIAQKASSDSGIAEEEGYSLLPLDVHIAGIAADNTTPIIVCLGEVLPKALNIGNYDLFHVEDGKTVPMTRVHTISELDAHNEFYYDPATGAVTVAMASFSEVALRNTAAQWTGEADHTWYNTTDTTLYIYNADQLWSFSQIVGGMASGIEQDSFKGKTVILHADLDLNDLDSEDGRVFYPIGYWNSEGTYAKTGNAITSGFYAFQGTFDGNGHTIANFYHNTWEMKGDHNWYSPEEQNYRDGMGLFGKVYGGTVKNLTVENFSSDGEIATTGTIAAYADNGATFENIAIFNCNPRVYNIGNGGIVGCVGWYNNETEDTTPVTFKNITVDNSNKISALWGSYDVACGGLVGQYYPTSGQENETDNAGIYMDNCHVSAQIDVYNDVCGNYMYYAYRYAGMLIGSVRENIAGDGSKLYPDTGRVYPNVEDITAKDCTVHYGEWNHYYYCEFESNGHPSYAQADEYKFSRVPESELVRDDEGKVIGCTHTHTDVEDNRAVYLPFYDQLVTGYGWGVTSMGITDIDGVTVLDRVVADSVVKFDKAVADGTTYWTDAEVTIGDLFTENSEIPDILAINSENVQVSVSPVGATSTAGAMYTANTDDWTEGTLTFSGKGAAEIIITDYYYCVATTLAINVENPVVRYWDYNSVSSVDCGDNGVTLPDADAPDGKTFIGWSETKLESAVTEMPVILEAGSTYKADQAMVDLYAVYQFGAESTGITYEETALADISATDKVIITMTANNGSGTTYALSSANGSSAAPAAIVVTVSGTAINADALNTTNLLWNIANDNGNLTIYPDGTTSTWLYTTSTNNGTRVGTNANNIWTIDASSGYLKNTGTSRYLGVYTTNPDWRSYTNTTGNTANQVLRFYKEVAGQGGAAGSYYQSFTLSECEHTNTTEVRVEPTCQTEGSVTVICNDCREQVGETEILPIAGHNYVEGTCTVCGDTKAGEWKLVTDINQLNIGDKVIIAAAEYDVALSTTQNNNNRGQVSIIKDTANDSAELSDGVQILILEAGTVENTYAFHATEGETTGYLYAASSSSNYLRTQATNDANSSWTIAINAEGVATVTAKGTNTHNLMQYNSTSSLFASYLNSQKDISIYRWAVYCKHSGEYTEVTVDPTCTEAGYSYKVCSVCGTHYDVTEGAAATGHSYASEVTTEASCTEAGEMTYSCYNCEHSYTEVIEATGHNYTNGTCATCGAAEAAISTTYTFSEYTVGTQYAQGEEHTLDENLKLTINGAHLNGEVRLYAGSNAVLTSTKTISSIVVNAGNKAGTLNIYTSEDGVTWTLANSFDTTSAYTDYEVTGINTNYIKLESVGAQIRIKNATLTMK